LALLARMRASEVGMGAVPLVNEACPGNYRRRL
jgi:hypothetical protein